MSHAPIVSVRISRTVKVFDATVKPGQNRSSAGIALGDWLMPLGDYAAQRGVCIVGQGLAHALDGALDPAVQYLQVGKQGRQLRIRVPSGRCGLRIDHLNYSRYTAALGATQVWVGAPTLLCHSERSEESVGIGRMLGFRVPTSSQVLPFRVHLLYQCHLLGS